MFALAPEGDGGLNDEDACALVKIGGSNKSLLKKPVDDA
jgi:hypothetical protein